MHTIERGDVIDALYSAGLNDDALRDDYSGRGMYGDQCFGIVVDDIGEAFGFIAQLASREAVLAQHENRADDLRWMSGASMDSMGLSTIVYWPRVKVTS